MQAVVLMMLSYGAVHLVIGCIRGLYRYKMIQKYQYDYYDTHPLSFMGRVVHNLNYGIFSLTTFYISASIIVFAFFAFNAWKQL